MDILPIVEFAINNTPNTTTGYSAFYLNYGYHPLHPLQLLHSPEETNIEAVAQFTSRMQQDFNMALQQFAEGKRSDDATDRQAETCSGISGRRAGVTEHQKH